MFVPIDNLRRETKLYLETSKNQMATQLRSIVYLVSLLGLICEANSFSDNCVTGGKSIRGDVTSGVLSSPPSWSKEKSCLWSIRIPENKSLKLEFTKFDLKEQQLCPNSNVDITSQGVTTRYCGKEAPNPSFFNGPQSVIIYHSLGRIPGKDAGSGIEITFRQIEDSQIERCDSSQLTCRNGKCVSKQRACDGVDDCQDGTDEEKCGYKTEIPKTCGTPKIKPEMFGRDRIVGGEESIPGSWPWQISIQKVDIYPSGHVCGGSLINNFWVVTAGHCFERRKGPMVRIRLGDHNTFKAEGQELTRYVDKVVVHPSYDPEPKNDIALLKLNAPISFRDNISPVCLPSMGQPLPDGESLFMTGWGDTMTHGESDVLRQTSAPLLNWTKCNELYFGTVSDKTLCILNPGGGRSTCMGDSGGPLVKNVNDKWTLFGIVSWGHKMCGTERGPAVFTDTRQFLDFIQRTIAEE